MFRRQTPSVDWSSLGHLGSAARWLSSIFRLLFLVLFLFLFGLLLFGLAVVMTANRIVHLHVTLLAEDVEAAGIGVLVEMLGTEAMHRVGREPRASVFLRDFLECHVRY